MELWQAIAIAFMYYFSDSPCPWAGYYAWQRPLVGGLLLA